MNETVDRLYKLGADVITARDAPIHASGHGYAEELKLMLNLTNPRYVMPAHGDHKRIKLHSELAQAVGIPAENIFRGDNGLPLDIDESGAAFGSHEQSGLVFVYGMDVGDIENVALRDRRMLSADGIFIVVATIAEQDGRSVADPEVIFRGVPSQQDAEALLDDLRDAVVDSLERSAEGGHPRDRRAPGRPARRPGRVRLPAHEALADGSAGGRRGLAAGRRRSRRPSRPCRRPRRRSP